MVVVRESEDRDFALKKSAAGLDSLEHEGDSIIPM